MTAKGRGICMNAVFSNYNVTSVVRAAVIGSVNLLARVVFAALDIWLCCKLRRFLPLIDCITGGQQERHQQLVCATKQHSATSETGGWCRTASGAGTRLYVTDHQLAEALANLFEHKSVISLGDGQGHYRRIVLKTGKVSKYDAFDGAPFITNITDGQVRQVSIMTSCVTVFVTSLFCNK